MVWFALQVWVSDTRFACIINIFGRQMIQRGFHPATSLHFQWHYYSVKPVNLKPLSWEGGAQTVSAHQIDAALARGPLCGTFFGLEQGSVKTGGF